MEAVGELDRCREGPLGRSHGPPVGGLVGENLRVPLRLGRRLGPVDRHPAPGQLAEAGEDIGSEGGLVLGVARDQEQLPELRERDAVFLPPERVEDVGPVGLGQRNGLGGVRAHGSFRGATRPGPAGRRGG